MATIKIKLGARPKTIHRIIKLQLPEGGEGILEVDFKYRTRREYAAYFDGILESKAEAARVAAEEVAAAAKAAEEALAAGNEPPQPSARVTMLSIADETVSANARDLLGILDGWALDVPLNEDNLDQLCDEFPGVAESLMNAYRIALTEARSGN